MIDPMATPSRAGSVLRWILALLSVVLTGAASLAGAAPALAATSTYAYDTAAYTYGTAALLSSPDTAATDARGSPSGPVAVSGARTVSVARDGVAANTGSRLLRPSSLADELAQSTGGVVKANKGGYTVNIPNGSRGITVRVMERGGSRTNYYRVSVPGKETYTVTGEASMDANLTHIGIGENSLDDILSIVARIQGGS